MVIKDGLSKEIKERNKMQGITATTSAMTAWAMGTSGDISFKQFADKLGLFDNEYTEQATDKISKERKAEKIKNSTQQILGDVFSEE